MSFTSLLGKDNSKLGSIELGVAPSIGRSVSQTLTFSDSITKILIKHISQSLTLSQIVVTGTYYKDTLSLTDSLTHERVHIVNDHLNLSQTTDLRIASGTSSTSFHRCVDDILDFSETVSSANNHSFVYSFHDPLVLYQPCIVSEVSHSVSAIYRTIIDTVSLTDHLVHTTNNILDDSVNQSLSFSQTVTWTKGQILSRSLNQSLTFSQSLTTDRQISEHDVNHNLSLSQTITSSLGTITSKSVSSTLSLTDHNTLVVIRSHLSSSVDTLSFSQSNTYLHIINRDLSSTLSFSQSIAYYKRHNIRLVDRLSLTDDIIANRYTHVSFTDTFLFNDSYPLYLNYATPITIPVIDERLIKG